MNEKSVYHSVIVICLSLLLTFSLNAQNKFEGKVNIKVTSDGDEATMGYLIKDNMMRFEMGEDVSQYSLIDFTNKKMLMVMPEDEMYMEIPASKIFSDVQKEANAEMGKINKTGETKEINGYTCEKWIYKDDDITTESWLAKDLGGFIFLDNPMGGSKSEWQTEIETSGYFPMLIINLDEDGEEESRWEVTSVEKKSLSADLFAPPANYEKMTMPEINLDLFK